MEHKDGSGDSDRYEHSFKSIVESLIIIVVLVGDASVGKTFLLTRYMRNTLPKTASPTIGVEFATKIVRLANSIPIKAQIWDTAGQEKYRAMTSA